MYTMNHEFDPRTLDTGDDYVVHVTNDPEFYRQYMAAVNGRKNIPASECMGFGNFGHIFREYKAQVTFQDQKHFRKLVQNLLWVHYCDQFCDGGYRAMMARKHPIKVVEQKQKTDELYDLFINPDWLAPQQHLDNAQQHFRNVENQMNTLSKFQDQASATVQLIHGRPAEDYTESELMELIRKAQSNQKAIADLVDTSERMKKKHEAYAEDIKVYVAALDRLS